MAILEPRQASFELAKAVLARATGPVYLSAKNWPDPLAPVPRVPDRVAVVLTTSGSTGRPKLVAYTREALLGAALRSLDRLGRGQWLLALPTHLIAGWQILVRSAVTGLAPLTLSGSFSVEQFMKKASELQGDKPLVSLVPTQLSELLLAAKQDPSVAKLLRRFGALLVGGAPTPIELKRLAKSLRLNLVFSYGASETVGGCVYDGQALPGVRLRIRDGLLEISAPDMALGYLDSKGQILRDGFVEEGSTCWFSTRDRARLDGRELTVTGRADRVINSGGLKLDLDWLEAKLARFGEVAVIGAKSERFGQKACVFTTNLASSSCSGRELKNYLKTLGPPAASARVVVLAALPRLISGKVDRRALEGLIC